MLDRNFTLTLIALIIATSVFAGLGSASPTVSISGGNTLTAGETVFLNGTGFSPNTTVRIDLVIPSGTVVTGVVTNITDTNGTFMIPITVPDYDGAGYIKTVCGSDTVSTLVTFEGTAVYTMIVSYPYQIYADEITRFRIEQPNLNAQNYVLIADVLSPEMVLTQTYWVLHEGMGSVQINFPEEGDYGVTISVDGTKYTWDEEITVLESRTIIDDGGDGNTTDTTNITWTVSTIENKFNINLFAEGTGYISTGVIRVIKPDATISDAPIVSGLATITAERKGTYQFQFTYQNSLFIKEATYNPQITFTATSFSNEGVTTLTALVDGKSPTDNLICTVTSSDVQSTVSLVGGTGTFSTSEVGTYTFTLDYNGAIATTTSSYSETYAVRDFRVIQTDDNYVSVTGKVVGENSGIGKSNARVIITIASIGYSGEAKTTSSGTFSAYIPVSTGDKGGIFGGDTITIEYEYGTDQDSASLKLTNNWVKDLWAVWILSTIGILFYLKERGILYRYFKMFPPKGAQGEDDGSLDDFDDQTFG